MTNVIPKTTMTLESYQESLRGLIEIQKNSIAPGYMYGLLNGLIVAHNSVPIPGTYIQYPPNPVTPKKVRHKSAKP